MRLSDGDVMSIAIRHRGNRHIRICGVDMSLIDSKFETCPVINNLLILLTV